MPIILGPSYLVIALCFLFVLQMDSTKRHTYRFFAYVCVYLNFNELCSLNDDNHLRKIKLGDNKLNLRHRCLRTDCFSYIFSSVSFSISSLISSPLPSKDTIDPWTPERTSELGRVHSWGLESSECASSLSWLSWYSSHSQICTRGRALFQIFI